MVSRLAKWTVRLFSSSLQAMTRDLKAWERGGLAAFFGFSKRISLPHGAERQPAGRLRYPLFDPVRPENARAFS